MPAPNPSPVPVPVLTPKPAIEPEKPYFPEPLIHNPSGLTPEQLQHSAESDRPLPHTIVNEIPFIVVGTGVFLLLAPAGAVAVVAVIGVRGLAHAL